MLRRTKITFLVLAAAGAAGCARSDFVVNAQDRQGPASIEDSRIANAPDEVPPKLAPETHFAAAQLLEARGNFDGALQQYRKAIALNHYYVAGYHRLGLLLGHVGQHEKAVVELRHAVRLLPDNGILHNNLAYELMLLRQWADAERGFAQAIELRPDFSRAYINRGMVLSKMNRFDEALESFRRVLPEADAHYNLGLMYRGQHRYEEAADAFRYVLALFPDFMAAITQLEQLAPFIEPLPTDEALVEQGESTEFGIPIVSTEPDDFRDPNAWHEMDDAVDGAQPDQPFFVTDWRTEEAYADYASAAMGGASNERNDVMLPLKWYAEFGRDGDIQNEPFDPYTRLEIVRNEIACWEAIGAERRQWVRFASIGPVCETPPEFVTFSSDDFIGPALDTHDVILPWWESNDVSQMTLDELFALPQQPTPLVPQRPTMASTLVDDEDADDTLDTTGEVGPPEPEAASDDINEDAIHTDHEAYDGLDSDDDVEPFDSVSLHPTLDSVIASIDLGDGCLDELLSSSPVVPTTAECFADGDDTQMSSDASVFDQDADLTPYESSVDAGRLDVPPITGGTVAVASWMSSELLPMASRYRLVSRASREQFAPLSEPAP